MALKKSFLFVLLPSKRCRSASRQSHLLTSQWFCDLISLSLSRSTTEHPKHRRTSAAISTLRFCDLIFSPLSLSLPSRA